MFANRITTFALVTTAVAMLAVIATLARDVAGGPLDPPAPPGSTQAIVEPRQPISQPVAPATFPIVISQPGSYYLTGNITGIGGGARGIEVNAANVTIDLNGFSMTGVAGSSNAIHAAGAANNLTVRNGVIRGWGGGVFAPNASGGVYSDLNIFGGSLSMEVASASTIARTTMRVDSSTALRMTVGTSGGLVTDSSITGGSLTVIVLGADVVFRRTTIGNGAQGLNHGGAGALGLWFDQGHINHYNFGYVLDGSTAIVTRSVFAQNAGFAGNGTNNHVGTTAVITTPNVVTSSDVWSNIKY